MELIPPFGADLRQEETMPRRKTRLQIVSRRPESDVRKAGDSERTRSKSARATELPRVSGRWLLGAVALTVAAAALCGWCTLCLLFWQGSWQLLYHPATAIARTPASAGLTFDSVGFAATDAGVPQLSGWWIPAAPSAAFSRFTVLYLHGQDGNLGGTVDALSRLHAVGVNVLAFDYRGYGQSAFARPSEAHWRQDAEWALQYLSETRHIDRAAIVLDGHSLGANLALEVAAAHPELAGVVLDSALDDPMAVVFHDARARLVPARLLVRDRYELNQAATALRIPSLWLERIAQPGQSGSTREPDAYRKAQAQKMLVWLNPSTDTDKQLEDALSRWLDEIR
jgi:hypothetical protein